MEPGRTTNNGEAQKDNRSRGSGGGEEEEEEDPDSSVIIAIKNNENGIAIEEMADPNPGTDASEASQVRNERAIDGVEIGEGESLKAEKVCRICHLGVENSSQDSQLIQLGCGCKHELGFSHRHCAETWFKQRGSRKCEICGMIAKNVTRVQDVRIYMVEWNEMGLMDATTSTNPSSVREGYCRCKKGVCNLLFACMLMVFVLSWLFHVGML